MIYVECIKSDDSGRRIGTKMEKVFTDQVDFMYFYKCAQRDGWDFVNVRTFDPNKEPMLASHYDIMLLRTARNV